MYRDRRDVRDIPVNLRLSERQFLQVRAVSERRGTQFAATVRDLLMEAMLMAEHGSAPAGNGEDTRKQQKPFNSEEAACRAGEPFSICRPIFTGASATSLGNGESPSMRPSPNCSPSA